ncbi:MAG: hypothetical protein R2764_17065 [Bacteroidales bacterium]
MITQPNVGSSSTQCPLKKNKETEKTEEPKYKNISIKCKHRTCPPQSYLKTFELVPEQASPVYDEIVINWTGMNPRPPDTLELIEDGKSKEIKGPPFIIPLNNESATSLFPDSYKKASKSKQVEFGKALLDTISTYSKSRDLVISGLPDGRFRVKVHNPDRWILKVNLPLPGTYKKKTGTKWEGVYGQGKKYEKTESETTGSHTLTTETKKGGSQYKHFDKEEVTHTLEGDGVVESQTSTTYTSKSGQGSITYTKDPVKKESSDSIVKLEKNGSPISINGLGFLYFIGQLMKWVQLMSEILKDIPKAGAYIEYSFSVMEGDFSLEWGWKEYKPDHQAYYNYVGQFNIVFVNLTLELGVGISGFSFKFQAFASINGKLDLTATFQNTSPVGTENTDPDSEPAKATIKGSIVGAVGARFEALYFVKIEATVSAGIEITGDVIAFKKSKPFELKSSLDFTGIIGQVTGAKGRAGVNGVQKSKTSEPKVLVNPKNIGDWTWPKDLKKPKEVKMTDNDLKKEIKRMLNGHYKNSGYFNGKDIRVKEWMDWSELEKESKLSRFYKYGVLGQDPVKETDENKLVRLIFKIVDKQKYFDRSQESIELFLSKVYEQLVPLMKDREGHKLEFNYIEWDDFVGYFNSQKFKDLLKEHHDDAKEFIDVNC